MLLVSPRAPLPVAGGADLRILQHCAVLRRMGWEVHLFAVDPREPGAGNDQLARCHDAGDPAAVAVQGADDRRRLTWITTGANPFDDVATPTVRRRLREVRDAVQPAVVVLSGHEVAPLLEDARAPGRPVVVDLHNVLAQVMRDGADLAAGHRAQALLHRRAAQAAEALDDELVDAADEVWCCSEVDAALLRSRRPHASPVAVPNGVDVASYGPHDPAPEPRVVLTASFRYLPNERAAHELLDALDALPDVHLHLVGADVQPQLRERVDATPRAHATGWVPDIRPHLRAGWIAAMPLRGGSGTRLKVAEAAATGVPIVATAKAVEGIAMEPGHHYRAAESPDAVVGAIRDLVADGQERRRLAEAAHGFAVEHLSWEAAAAAMTGSLGRLSGATAG